MLLLHLASMQWVVSRAVHTLNAIARTKNYASLRGLKAICALLILVVAALVVQTGTPVQPHGVSVIFEDEYACSLGHGSQHNVAFIRIGLQQSKGSKPTFYTSSALCDLGSAVNLIHKNVVTSYIEGKPCMAKEIVWFGKDTRRYRVANNKHMRAVGMVELKVNYSHKISSKIKFLIAEELTCPIIIGKPTLHSLGSLIDLEPSDQNVTFRGLSSPLKMPLYDFLMESEK